MYQDLTTALQMHQAGGSAVDLLQVFLAETGSRFRTLLRRHQFSLSHKESCHVSFLPKLSRQS